MVKVVAAVGLIAEPRNRKSVLVVGDENALFELRIEVLTFSSILGLHQHRVQFFLGMLFGSEIVGGFWEKKKVKKFSYCRRGSTRWPLIVIITI